MLDKVGNFIKTLVRPTVTVGLGLAVVERLCKADLEGAKFLGTFFGIAMTFWFVDRSGSNDNTSAVDTTTVAQ